MFAVGDVRAVLAAQRVAQLLVEPLGMDEAVQVALLNNRGLQAAYAELGITEADVVQAGRLPNPGFCFGRLTRGDEGLCFGRSDATTPPMRKLILLAALAAAPLTAQIHPAARRRHIVRAHHHRARACRLSRKFPSGWANRIPAPRTRQCGVARNFQTVAPLRRLAL